jgi:hypothetical protein
MSFIEINGEQMMKCNYCGNIWDGYAQCNCWKWIDYAEVDANKVVQGANEVDANEVDANEVETNEVDEVGANANEVVQDANEVDANEVDANEVDANEVDATKEDKI